MTARVARRYASVLVCIAAPVAGAQKVADVFDPLPKAVAVPVAQFQPAVARRDSTFECGRPYYNSALHLSIVSAALPNRAASTATLSVQFDDSGRMVSAAESRGPSIRPNVAGLSPEQVGAAVSAEARSVRRTTFNFNFGTGRATLANRGGGLPDTSTTAYLAQVLQSDAFGRPGALVERVLAACRDR
jgi:hypothetical protein